MEQHKTSLRDWQTLSRRTVKKSTRSWQSSISVKSELYVGRTVSHGPHQFWWQSITEQDEVVGKERPWEQGRQTHLTVYSQILPRAIESVRYL